MLRMQLLSAPSLPRVATVTQVQRCGGVSCPPGTCDHDGEPKRTATGVAPVADVRAPVAPPSHGLRVSSPSDPAELEAERLAANPDRHARAQA
jgi:hypothetical protein